MAKEIKLAPKILIGPNLKQLRDNKKMSLTELSQRSGIQIATLSRMENNRMTGTLESHMVIAEALGVHLADIYKEIEKGTPLIRKKSPPAANVETFTYNDQAYYEILTQNIKFKKMLPLVMKIEAEGKTSKERGLVGAEKFIFVLEGEVEINIQEQSYPLKKDNAFYFDASFEHYIKNPRKTPARILCVRSPVNL